MASPTDGRLDVLNAWFNTPYKTARQVAQGITGLVYVAVGADLFQWNISNLNTVAVYVKLYDLKTVPTASDVPIATLTIPAGFTAFDGNTGSPNYHFNTGIAIRASTAIADADGNAAPGTALYIDINYR